MKKILIAAVSVFTTFVLISATVIRGYKPGDAVQNFTLKNVDGSMVSLEGYTNAKGAIVVFTCNHCPFAKLYQERLNTLNEKYSKEGFPVIAISSNDAIAVPEDSYRHMKERAQEKKYTFPYLYDETQEVARAFGAVKTPQAFVLLKENNKWIVKYSGSIDDNGAEPDQVKQHYVEEAINALENNKPVATETTKSVGCAIKWKQ